METVSKRVTRVTGFSDRRSERRPQTKERSGEALAASTAHEGVCALTAKAQEEVQTGPCSLLSFTMTLAQLLATLRGTGTLSRGFKTHCQSCKTTTPPSHTHTHPLVRRAATTTPPVGGRGARDVGCAAGSPHRACICLCEKEDFDSARQFARHFQTTPKFQHARLSGSLAFHHRKLAGSFCRNLFLFASLKVAAAAGDAFHRGIGRGSGDDGLGRQREAAVASARPPAGVSRSVPGFCGEGMNGRALKKGGQKKRAKKRPRLKAAVQHRNVQRHLLRASAEQEFPGRRQNAALQNPPSSA